MKIAILGAGVFGTALGGILADNGHNVAYYDKYIEGADIHKVIEGAEYVVLCVPSAVVQDVLPDIPREKPLVVATKGILLDDVFGEFADYMVLSGPGFAADIKSHQSTKLTATDERVVELFVAPYMQYDITSDKRGVLMCGALKNVYALWAGYQDLRPGTPEYEEYIATAAREMKELLSANDAQPGTVDLACGVGDLRLTCDSPSRNYQYGQALRNTPDMKPETTVEGLTTLMRIKSGEIVVPDSAEILKHIMQEISVN